MVFALASSRKSRSCCDKPLTLCTTCCRVKASMDVSVPISGVKPGCGPTIHAFSVAAADPRRRARAGNPNASPTPPFRKLRRPGTHSTGNIRYTSIADVLGSNHTAATENLRGYYLCRQTQMREICEPCWTRFPYV